MQRMASSSRGRPERGAAGRRRLGLIVAGLLSALFPLAAEAGAPPAPPQAAGGQQPQGEPAEPEGVNWGTGWTFGARGIIGVSREESVDPGIGFSGFAVLPLTTDLELEGEIGYLRSNAQANGLPEGRLSTFPVRATLRVQLWRFGGGKPYAGAGGGLYLGRFELDAAVAEELAAIGFGADATIDPGVGLHLAAGMEWERGRFHLGFDVKYVFGDADTVSTVVDQLNGEVFREPSTLDLDGLWLAAGARVSF